MSIAIKVFFLVLLFLLVESSAAKNLELFERSADGRLRLRKLDESEISYFGCFRGKIERLQLEADKKYPLWKSRNYVDRALFLVEEAQAYVQLWYNRHKNHETGNPYDDLRYNVQGDLWPMHYAYCRQSEGMNLLTYMMSDFCRQSEGTNLLKYMTYGLSPEADLV